MSYHKVVQKKEIKPDDSELNDKLIKIIGLVKNEAGEAFLKDISNHWHRVEEDWPYSLTISNYIKKSQKFEFIKGRPGMHKCKIVGGGAATKKPAPKKSPVKPVKKAPLKKSPVTKKPVVRKPAPKSKPVGNKNAVARPRTAAVPKTKPPKKDFSKKPAPKKPAPRKPAPKKPAPKKPAPRKTEPKKPEPRKPAPKKPTNVKPKAEKKDVILAETGYTEKDLTKFVEDVEKYVNRIVMTLLKHRVLSLGIVNEKMFDFKNKTEYEILEQLEEVLKVLSKE